jgi:hypothetical protein
LGIVYVADRENSRIQLFTDAGIFVGEWTDVARPCQVFIDRAGWRNLMCRRPLQITVGDMNVSQFIDLFHRWILFAHQVIHFGRNICDARKPKCAVCPIDPVCYAKDKQA